jgi:hypothetical protein
MVWVNVTA